MHVLLHVLGLDNPSGHLYLFWSGIGADLGYLAALTVLYRKIACHVDGCHRIGLHHVAGTMYTTCRRHHPTGGLTTAEDIARAREGALADADRGRAHHQE